MILFSLIIPVYNARSYLARLWNSLQSQSYPHWQAIFVDDASCDGSSDILKTYQKQDPRVQVVFLKTNHGQAYARNEGIKQAKADWLLFCDADDAYFQDALERLSPYAKAHCWDILYFNACVIHSNLSKPSQEGCLVGAHTVPLWKKESFDCAHKSYAQSLLDINLSFKSPWSLAISRKWLEKVGILFENNSLEDWLFNWQLIAKHPRFYFLNEVLYQHFHLENPECVTLINQACQENNRVFDSLFVFKKGQEALKQLQEYAVLEEKIYERGLETVLGSWAALVKTSYHSKEAKSLCWRYLEEWHALLRPLSLAYRHKILLKYLSKHDPLLVFLCEPLRKDRLRALLNWYDKPSVKLKKYLKEKTKAFLRRKGLAQESKALLLCLKTLPCLAKNILIIVKKLIKP